MKRTLTTLTLLALCGVSHASQLPYQWFHGDWNCTIDGRSARMVWKVVNDPQTHCDGEVCSTSSGVALRGWFNDSNSRWVPLEQPRVQDNNLRFVYTGDRTNWFLRTDASQRFAAGNTVWRGKAYPLSCAKR